MQTFFRHKHILLVVYLIVQKILKNNSITFTERSYLITSPKSHHTDILLIPNSLVKFSLFSGEVNLCYPEKSSVPCTLTKALKVVKVEEPLKTVEVDAKTMKTVKVDCNDPSSIYILSDL